MTELTETGSGFSNFFMLYLDQTGRFIDPGSEVDGENRLVPADELPIFLKKTIKLPDKVTDVFVWVHGWQNDELRAAQTARKLFANLSIWLTREKARYPKLGEVVPAFVAVHWPSTSLPTPGGYTKIRNRAKQMTTEGEAEFFLASLLGYLDKDNARSPGRKVLVARGGYYLHCLGHSFGGRFLAAAIQFAAKPKEQRRKILAAAHRETGFDYNVDSLCVLQMAAGKSSFASDFSLLLKGPLCGPVVLTSSDSDSALCRWHAIAEGEEGVGCHGAAEPRDRIGSLKIRPVGEKYGPDDFARDITNVNASDLYVGGPWIEGAHSQFWHTETMHLVASLVEQVRRSPG
jgi:hypothetical protein